MSNNTMVFFCKICNKNYKSKKSLYVHNHKYHKKITQNNTQTALNSTQTAPNSTKKINKINNKICPFCNLTFTRLYSKNRHMKICKVKNEKENTEQALINYQNKRMLRTARVQLHSREIGKRVYHADGVHALLRNQIMKSKTQDDWYNDIEWLYGRTGLDN